MHNPIYYNKIAQIAATMLFIIFNFTNDWRFIVDYKQGKKMLLRVFIGLKLRNGKRIISFIAYISCC